MLFSPLLNAGLVTLAATVALRVAIGSRFIHARLLFSIWLLLAFVVVEIAVTQSSATSLCCPASPGCCSFSR
jgi:hypothetical protein